MSAHLSRFRGPSPARVAATVAGLWSVACGAYTAWLVLTYRANLAMVCRPGSDYEIFCRAHQADDLLAALVRTGAVFLVGCVVIGLGLLLAGEPNRRATA